MQQLMQIMTELHQRTLAVIINCDDKVWPMVAPGAAISEVFTAEDMKKEK